jgi:PAS domain S-box-containing protein
MNNFYLLPIVSKALDQARDGITISDAKQADNPLIYVNKSFLRMTGYSYAEVIGKNCRFLQGANVDQPGLQAIRKGIKEKQPVVAELINYRKTGEAFWNKLSITPIFDALGNLTHYIGVQDDLTIIKEKEAIEQQAHNQKQLTKAILNAQEEERAFIGRELHDNINQLMVAARLSLNMMDEPALKEKAIADTKMILDKAIKDIRQLSHSLVGPQWDGLTLRQSLEELLCMFASGNNFQTSISWIGSEEELEENKKIVVYRIVQEQLNNIIKYAKAQHVSLSLLIDKETLKVSIQDDGEGFESSQQTTGIGLRNMQTRLEMVGGTMNINTAIGKGCQLNIVLPL